MGSFIRVADFDCRRAFVLIGVVVASGLAAGRTIHVPADYPTVQGAIDATHAGDTIIVAPGRYFERVQFPSHDIVLRSEDPTSPSVVMSTILDGRSGNSSGPVVQFTGKESAACRLAGFTITNGLTTAPDQVGGAGISGGGTVALIDHNRVVGNTAYGYGGWEVHYQTFGGGVLGAENLRYNLIAFNYSGGGWGYGGGISGCKGVGNIIVYNSAGFGAGACSSTLYDSVIAFNEGAYGSWDSSGGADNIIWGNTGYPAYQIGDGDDPGSYNCIQDYPTAAGVGLINADPRFVDPSKDVLDFHLRADSPCIDAGTSSIGSWAGAPDIDGDPRPFRAYPPFVRRGDGTGYDIGADEYIGHPAPSLLPDAIKAWIIAWPMDPVPPGLDVNHDGVVDAADFILALIPAR